MAALTEWIRKTVENLVDPDKEERIQTLVNLLHQGIRTQRQDFSLRAAVQTLDFSSKDLEMAKEQVYRTILARGWSDEKLTSSEQEVARWVAKCLEIPESKALEINQGFARDYFAWALAQAMEDGILDDREEARLREIAASIGLSLPQFAAHFFRSECEAFLRGIFLACVADSHISQSEWDHLLSTTRKLGISRDELLRTIQPQAETFVEHVLADAKADGRLSDQEDRTLRWLTDNLGLRPEYRAYIQGEVGVLRTLTQIELGKLPSLAYPHGIEVHAGEIVHFHGRAVWRQLRMLKSGPRYDDHQGTLTLTDNRLLFSSPTKSQSIGFRSIVSHRGAPRRIEVQVKGKPASNYFLTDTTPVPYAILRRALSMANQRFVTQPEAIAAGQIPRDVRQRVWQRYGGRCAECGATDYLEFDHIVPRAKGGSDSDANVQLLCRRCNLKKSDSI